MLLIDLSTGHIRPFVSHSLLCLCSWMLLVTGAVSTLAVAQGPGGGGGPGQAAAPAFAAPKFRDRVWEAGGPRLSGLHKGKLVKGVEIVGNRSVSSHKILSHMQTREDRNFDEKQLAADIHELYRTELFGKIDFSLKEYPDGILIRLEVTEQPLVTDVIFHGNTRIDDKMLGKHCGIEPGDPINPFSVDMARQRLIDLYKDKGFNQIAVEVKEGNRAGERRVYLEISEGPLERIWSIKFVGNAIFSNALLKTKIQSRDARYGVTTYAFNKANMARVEDDARALEAYYRSLGYFKARIDYRVDYYDGGDFLKLTFVIDEGERYRIRNVAFIGNQFFKTETLMSALELKAGDEFNLGKMNRDQRKLRNEFYGREGFVYVDIVPEPRFLEEPGQLDLVYRISEGDQYIAGDINIHIVGDSSHTKHSVPMNMISVREGQVINLKELEDSERRLRLQQIFETNPAMGEPPSIEVRSPDRQEL